MSDRDQGDARGLGDPGASSETTSTKHTKPFRFKDKSACSSPTSRSRSRSASPSSGHHHRHRHQRRRHHHGRHRVRKPSPRRSPVPDAETAFRQSLFDALADDEGAAFWEGVYGQPIHKYPDTKVGPDGELERMTDEEYTTYVRRRMWEKSREGIEEARQAKARERRQREQAEEQAKRSRRQRSNDAADSSNSKYDRDVFDIDFDASLHRRGYSSRKSEKVWQSRWHEYLQAWSNLHSLSLNSTTATTNNTTAATDSSPNPPPLKTLLSWPNLTNSPTDISTKEIESFFRHSPPSSSSSSSTSTSTATGTHTPPPNLLSTLKQERIRWHPDKIQQKYGKLGIEIDDQTRRWVTAVFQIVDELWGRERERERGEEDDA